MCGGCLRLSVLSIVEGQKVESPGKFAFTRGYSLNSQQVESSLLFFFIQGVKRHDAIKNCVRHRLYYLPDDSDLYLYYSQQALRVFNKE